MERKSPSTVPRSMDKRSMMNHYSPNRGSIVGGSRQKVKKQAVTFHLPAHLPRFIIQSVRAKCKHASLSSSVHLCRRHCLTHHPPKRPNAAVYSAADHATSCIHVQDKACEGHQSTKCSSVPPCANQPGNSPSNPHSASHAAVFKVSKSSMQ